MIIWLLLGASVGLYAQNPNIEQFQSELRQKNEKVTSIKCDFVQTREVSMLANAVTKEGTFHFQSPHNMLLAFNDGDYIKMTAEWFEMKTGENVSVTKVSSNPMLRNLNAILGACVGGDFDKMIKGFEVDCSLSQSEWIVTLTPQQAKAASKIARIVVRFDKNDMSLNLLKIEERTGDYTAYAFSHKQFNVALPDHLFNVSE